METKKEIKQLEKDLDSMKVKELSLKWRIVLGLTIIVLAVWSLIKIF